MAALFRRGNARAANDRVSLGGTLPFRPFAPSLPALAPSRRWSEILNHWEPKISWYCFKIEGMRALALTFRQYI
jgi:hypothetical protein